jgi:16S rRNA (guanine527-N7)-methyltransferase
MNAQYISDDELARLNVSRESLFKIEAYVDLLLTWQAKINLIGPSTVETVWRRHVLDALQLLPLMHSKAEAVADLAGAGIPGLVLALGNLRADLTRQWQGRLSREAIRQTKPMRGSSKSLETLRIIWNAYRIM